MHELPMSEIFKINGEPIPAPSGCSPKLTNLQIKADRSTADGLLHKETIRYNILSGAEVTYDAISDEQLRMICGMVRKEEEYFEFTYKDPLRGIRTATCYSNDFESGLYLAYRYNGLWRNVKFNCIER